MSCMMKSCARPRKHLMIIEKPITTQDVDGHVDLGDDANWKFVGKRRVAFETKGGFNKGDQGQIFDQVRGEADYLIHMQSDKFTRAIQSDWRGRIGTRKFNFGVVIDVDEARHTVVIQASEPK